MSVFEILMLLCFGVSWPISIAKSLRTRVVAGKSPLFMAIVIAGYACGILHKLLFSRDWVIALYALNLILVAVDMGIYFAYSGGRKSGAAAAAGMSRAPAGIPIKNRRSP